MSTIRDGVHSSGRFVRSYQSLECAKEAVLYRNDCIGWGNVTQENIIRVSLDERSLVEMEKDYMAKAEENARTHIEIMLAREPKSVLIKRDRKKLEEGFTNEEMPH